MKKYFIKYPRNFANEYYLVFAEKDEEIARLTETGFERIPLKEVRELCALEKHRRKTDPAFSGYATTEPISFREFVGVPW